ncbi:MULTISPECIES: CoA ester lyase [unclassified Herbaspirillum]|uniref:HpcH/HpaI aldolase/citrate lyase family protein n=1 Tax=unclassified Herbaspirillum TaxID=2624150 RepID=UPI001150C923|nr:MULTISPECIES: CoA ester lyase [unclassified Herbaspirillum]MBB5390051.1 malyl-CoA/(S)-citramalyl-CoA lyase [Herbaspirillum sp. SJZ102]TQK09448.1 beta-methylmalyl-CoA/L-malyl-CoA lyase [Herbaspirillum sp. SJZ130]TQK13865.1 beta-methylmalyl-CoA/L-malyl-CoA lyase [Herbaspirillum sp. SJZ106]TWC69588.1 beta-methylmalyl-CoA/L-malyl-CoA lyase [Herbaspirillum sp. SJZ099]
MTPASSGQTVRIVRTFLAVPAHRRRLVESAARSQADAVFLDLEDAVPESEKQQALDDALLALQELDWSGKHVAVRVNAFGSRFLQAEIETLAKKASRLDAIIIPKAERCGDIAAIAGWLDASETARAQPLQLELLIETALGLVQVDALAQSHARVSALHLGVGDFAASIGARSTEIGSSPDGYRQTVAAAGNYLSAPLDLFAYPMMRLLVAARAFNLRAVDGPCGAYRDATLTQAWAEKAAAMGFDGKQVIHPSQIAATRDAFIPDAAQQAFAQRVVAAMEDAERNGKGAVSVDGKMVDYANVRMAQRILRLAGHS